MPVFEYKCLECDGVSEFFQRGSKSAKGLTCCHCGSAKLEKMFSTFAGHVKTSSSAGENCRSCTNLGCPHAGE